MTKALVLFGTLLSGLGLCLVKAPHLRLAAKLASGQIDGHRIAVVDAPAASFDESTSEIHCGDLRFAVPDHASIQTLSEDVLCGLLVEVADLRCSLLPPGDRVYEDPDPLNVATQDGMGALKGLLALCTASGQDLGLWMRAAEVDRLEQRLALRRLLCLSAERVEVVRGDGACGLLFSWRGDGCVCMRFEYFSPDGRVRGQAFLLSHGESDEAMHLARALVSTFRLEPTREGAAQPGGSMAQARRARTAVAAAVTGP